jgi:hypothetical protein
MCPFLFLFFLNCPICIVVLQELLGLDVKYDDPKPQPRTKEYYQSRPCSELVGAAAQMLDELFTEGCDENIETHKENS